MIQTYFNFFNSEKPLLPLKENTQIFWLFGFFLDFMVFCKV